MFVNRSCLNENVIKGFTLFYWSSDVNKLLLNCLSIVRQSLDNIFSSHLCNFQT